MSLSLKDLFVRLGLDTDAQSFARAQLAVRGIELGLTAIVHVAGRAGRALGGMVTSVIETGDQIDELAQSTGISTDALQELAYAASFSSMDLQGVGGAMMKLTRNMQSAANGSEETASAFRKLGVPVKDSSGKLRAADDVLMDLAARFQTMPDSATKTALAMQIFGKTGGKMIPFLNEGREGIGRLREEAQRLGVVLDKDTIANAEKAADQMGVFKASLTGLKNQIVGPLIPLITEMSKGFSSWVASNKDLLRLRVGQFLKVIVGFFKLLWMIVRPLTKAFGFLSDHLHMVAVVMGGAVLAAILATAAASGIGVGAYLALGAAGLAAGLRAALGWVIAAAPVILLTAMLSALILIFEDLWVGMNGGQSLLFKGWQKLQNWLEPNGDDPWWLTAMKIFLKIITDLPEAFQVAFDFWMEKFDELVGWMAGTLKALGIIDTKEGSEAVDARMKSKSLLNPAAGGVIDLQRHDVEIGGTGQVLDMAQLNNMIYGMDDAFNKAPVTEFFPGTGRAGGAFFQAEIKIDATGASAGAAPAIKQAVKEGMDEFMNDRLRQAGEIAGF